ncbi:trypsin-like peptidase domain-containing protein [Kitasatospora purpeofusca]|uniref:nSTAND1 domain-containing NTPase n=1 Tax=Kitasatospora purpeofusca TaxID=67352 RepID=UPI0036D36515
MTPSGSYASGGIGPKALNTAVLRIRDTRGEAVGLGFLISPELALTCAHVVSAALGTPQEQEPLASARLQVDLPLLSATGQGSTGVSASVEDWLPPQEPGGGDVAVLRLDDPLSGAVPIRLIEAGEVWDHPVRAFGFPAGRPGGVWHSGVLRAGQSEGLLQVDLKGSGYPVSRGFSGTPVWDESLGGVVGMVAVAESGKLSASYLIPTVGLMDSVPRLRGLVLAPSPFRSLSAFQESDAQFFFGRQAESDELAQALIGEQWVTLVGASGSGKSSLALAGVVPRTRAAGALAVIVRPTSGSSPLTVLAAALLPLLEPELSETQRLVRLSGLTEVLRRGGLADIVPRLLELRNGRQLLVVVDQFEELLALAPEAVDELAAVLFAADLPCAVRVLTTLRADFLETALAHPRLGPALSRRLHALGPLSPERLREVVTAPVEAVPGIRYEAALVDRILEDTGTEPGALPLLGFTLDLLWQEQSGGLLTHEAYQNLGGVTGALSAHADQTWNEHVPEKDELSARRLFTQLVRVPTGSPAATRRMAMRAELGEHEWRVAQQLAVTRLLVTGRSAEGVETVELAHEALIRGWDKLTAWVGEDRSFLEWRESLRHDIDRWERAQRSPELLPTTVTLEGAQAWVTERAVDLTAAEHGYLERGRAYRRSRARRARTLRSGIAVVVVAAVTLATLFAVVRQQSQEREALATSRALTQASQDEASTDPVRSVMLALAAYQTSPTQEARNQLLRTYLMHSNKNRMISGMLGTVRNIQTSLDGNVILAASKSGRVTLFVHAVTGDIRITQVPSVSGVKFPLVSADGKRAGYVEENGRAAWFPVNADSDQPMGELHRLPEAPGAAVDANKDMSPTMSLDGTLIVSRVLDHLIWWDLNSDTIARSTPTPEEHDKEEIELWISPDNRTLLLRRSGWGDAENPKGLYVYDPTTGATRSVVASATDVPQIMLSGDRTAAVVCRRLAANRTAVSLIRISDGAQLGEPYSEQDKDFKPDQWAGCDVGSVNATGSLMGLRLLDKLTVVDLLHGTVLSRTLSPSDAIASGHLVSAGGKVFEITWEDSLITYTELQPGEAAPSAGDRRLTNDGSRTISVLADGSAIQLRPTTGSPALLAEAQRREPYWVPGLSGGLKLNHEGSLLASQEGQNVIAVREASTLREVAVITAAVPPPRTMDAPSILEPAPTGDASKWEFQYFFDFAGNVLTVSGTVVQQWDPRTGRELAHFDAKALQPRDATAGRTHLSVGSYPAPNKVYAITWGDPEIRIIDITTGAVTQTIRTAEDALAVQFDSSDRYFSLLRRGGLVELWQRDPLRKTLGPLRAIAEDTNTSFVARFIDRDGRFLIAANNAVRTYRVGDRAPENSYEFGEAPGSSSNRSYLFVDFSLDGSKVLYVGPSGSGGALALDPRTWRRELCKIIGYRQFTEDERASLPARLEEQPLCTER